MTRPWTQAKQRQTEKFKFIIKLRLLIQRMRERSHTLWSPPPVANRSPPGWTSLEKICMPSCLTQLGFSAIFFQKSVLPPKITFFFVLFEANSIHFSFLSQWGSGGSWELHQLSSKPTRFLQKLMLLKPTRTKLMEWKQNGIKGCFTYFFFFLNLVFMKSCLN